MIGTAAQHLAFSGSASAFPSQAACVRRRITPQAGHALEKLGHAIEYLTDEFMNEEGQPPFRRDGRLEAIELLMAANREIYYHCPEVPSFRTRFSAFLHRFV
ncbi:hypothetical protein [Occallatibacter riparius]|uniref:Uncharacterized protein n=1 Tax=Occallatibacter riparius TaxID=1002689 RepID=A0A9J7BPQ7_9BACT|nr:hypothetical protein [Occallatibacter riparius]UWZ82910.1 hypothetical protein MOP44_20355 [Occallatibacter riparius]